MSKFNPDFWEVTLSEEAWKGFSEQDHPFHESAEERDARHDRSARAQSIRSDLERLIAETLSDRQREVVELYFYEGLNQRQIAERLGISQQVISQHLYGKLRDGKVVGGALRKLRRACSQLGIDWP